MRCTQYLRHVALIIPLLVQPFLTKMDYRSELYTEELNWPNSHCSSKPLTFNTANTTAKIHWNPFISFGNAEVREYRHAWLRPLFKPTQFVQFVQNGRA